jgi:hypothetical protein
MALLLEPVVAAHLDGSGVPSRVDEIIAEEFGGKSIHGPVLLLAQQRVNKRLKDEGLCFAVLVEETRDDGTLYVQVKAY